MRSQLVGKSAGDPIRFDRDIRNIRGATLSCRHGTDGVRHLVAIFDQVRRKRCSRCFMPTPLTGELDWCLEYGVTAQHLLISCIAV